jgi:hypothetical protein
MKKTLIPILLFSLTTVSASAFAAGKMKPGLWEMTMKSDMIKAMPKISPEQMEQMRKMGLPIPSFQDGGMTTKACISKAMAERDHPPEMNRKEAGCESRNFKQSGSDYSVDIVCDGSDLKGNGKSTGHFSNGENFTSTYDFKGVAHGRPVNQHHETSGKWLSADCGDVKPMDEFLPKK